MAPSKKDRYPLNRGDFYIAKDDCLACGAPQAEAPDVIEHARDGHCYFKKQPQNEDELDQAIKAMMVSCIDALRYGGTDEKILKRLYENGMANLCDNTPNGEYVVLIYDRVEFSFDGAIDDLANSVIAGFTSIGSHIIIERYVNNQDNHFSFVMRWTSGATGLIYDCNRQTGNVYILRISSEKLKPLANMIGVGSLLHDILKAAPRISDIKWFARNMPDELSSEKPY